MVSDGRKTSRAEKWFRGWSTVQGAVNVAIAAFLAIKGVDPLIVSAVLANGAMQVVKPGAPINASSP